MYPTIRINGLYSANYEVSVGTTPVQVSGGTTALAALNNQPPCQQRNTLIITNAPTSTQTVYVSPSATCTNAGLKAIKTLLPGQEWSLDVNGNVPFYVVAAASGGLVTITEWM